MGLLERVYAQGSVLMYVFAADDRITVEDGVPGAISREVRPKLIAEIRSKIKNYDHSNTRNS